MLSKLSKLSPAAVGFMQALGVIVYILLLVSVLNVLESATRNEPPEFVAAGFFMLTFVFSALVCGSLVLGYPALLAIKGNVKRAVMVVAWSGLTFAMAVALVLVGLLVVA